MASADEGTPPFTIDQIKSGTDLINIREKGGSGPDLERAFQQRYNQKTLRGLPGITPEMEMGAKSLLVRLRHSKQLLLTITLYTSTGTVHLQGKTCKEWADYELKCLKELAEQPGDQAQGGADPGQADTEPVSEGDDASAKMESLQLAEPAATTAAQVYRDLYSACNKDPITALTNIAKRQGSEVQFECGIRAKIGEHRFPFVPCTKMEDKACRKQAADKALHTHLSSVAMLAEGGEQFTHFDKMGWLVHKKFSTLISTSNMDSCLDGRKVIAGMVMKSSEEDPGTVIAIGSGNRCVLGDKLSQEGKTVNDSHAEVIARRGSLRYLYRQLEEYKEAEDHPLLTGAGKGKLRVKEGITFHLYISTAPCGDASRFLSPSDGGGQSQPDCNKHGHKPVWNKDGHGLLTSKMEREQGTKPTKDCESQTWEGLIKGTQQLRTMSCSDKICRWNITGWQGALLSHFLEPVYLHSLTLGDLYDDGHLSRAVCCRLDRDNKDDVPVNHPKLGKITAFNPKRETQVTKEFSMNWTDGDEEPEVLDGTEGCTTKKNVSRISKSSLYQRFKQLAGRRLHGGEQHKSYHETKLAAQEFQKKKGWMVEECKKRGYGVWITKPVEQEDFA